MNRHRKPDNDIAVAGISNSESGRLAALRRYAIFDTAAEVGFDDLARLAAQVCGVTVGLITFSDGFRLFRKAKIGFDGGSFAPLSEGFCPIVVRNAAVLVIPDALAHPDYANNPVVTQAGVRFYAGVPLVTADGHTLGTLCVLSNTPQNLTAEQQTSLYALANQVIGQLELRRALRLAGSEGRRAEREAARVARQARRMALLAQASAQLLVAVDASEMVGALYASIANTFQLDTCFCYACEDGGLGLVASAGLTPEQVTIAALLEFGQTICGMVAASRESVHVTGIQDGGDPQAAFLKALGLDTYACTPLLADGELLGTLAFGRRGGAFSAGELEVLRTLVSYSAMAMLKLRATHLLAATIRRKAFLVELGDALRGLANPWEVMVTAAELLGGHLSADRVGYAEVDETGDYATVHHDWTRAEVTSLVGSYRLADFGPALVAALRAGRTVRLADTLAETLSEDEDVASGWAAANIRSTIIVPLVKDGRLVATFYVNSGKPRTWNDDEEALVREVAERTWAAVERARAEAALWEAKATLEQQVVERTIALRANEARLRTIFETSYQFQGLLALDGTLLDANATSLDAINSRIEDVVGLPFADTPWFAGTPGMPEKVRAAVATAAKGEAAHQHILVNLPTGWRSFDFALRPIRDAGGVIVAIVPEAIETTRRRETEDALRQSQKMEAVGQLTGGIAHDFNNMLQGITGSLDIMLHRISQGRVNELDQLVTGAMASAARAAALTHRLLAFSRRQALDSKPLRTNPLIASMEDLLRRTMGETIELDLVLAEDLWLTRCDRNQLESAILNLVINARDAMPDGGRLTIETCNAPLDDADAALDHSVNPGEYICISVRDTGVGMLPDVMSTPSIRSSPPSRQGRAPASAFL